MNEQEREALRQPYRQTKDADLRSRCQMLLLSADSHRVGGIAELTLFDKNGVLFWFDRYEAEEFAGLEDRPKSGRPPRADESHREALQTTVEHAPRAIGQPSSTWTCSDLADYLANHGRAPLSVEAVRRHLIDLGYGEDLIGSWDLSGLANANRVGGAG